MISELSSELSCYLDMALFISYEWLVLWPNYGLVVDSLWTKSRTVLCPVEGIIVWPVMAGGVALFQPIYACFETIV